MGTSLTELVEEFIDSVGLTLSQGAASLAPSSGLQAGPAYSQARSHGRFWALQQIAGIVLGVLKACKYHSLQPLGSVGVSTCADMTPCHAARSISEQQVG